MAVTARVDPIDRDIDLIISETLSPTAQSALLAATARDQLAQGEQQNQMVLGRIPPHHTYVDGVEQDEDRVKPDGTIVYEFALVLDLFTWIADQLRMHAPVGSGKDPHPGLYRSSFTFFADGTEVPIGDEIPADAQEYVFLSPLPYARKIERGLSSQAPNGVFEAVAAMAKQRFGNVARISFGYRSPILPYGGAPSRHSKKGGTWHGGAEWQTRVPAISIRVK